MGVPYYGDFVEDDTVNLPFNTFDSNDPANSVTATNLIASDIYVHKDGSATPITTDGATIDIDAPGVGAHMITIDTSVDAAYATGSEYSVRVDGVTVDGGTINAWVGSFSIERAGGALAILKSLTIANGAVDAKITYIMDTILTEGGAGRLAAAFIKLLDVATPVLTATSVNQAADNNTILTALDTLTKAAGGGDLAAIKTVTDALPDSGALTTIGTDTARLTAVRAAVLTDWINGGRLDLILDIIAADTTTDIPALIATAQSDLDKLTGTDGATLATAQGNYAPAVAGDDMGVDAGGVTAIWAFAMTDLAAVPGATAEVGDALSWLYMLNRNKVITDTSGSPDVIELYNNAGILIADSDISDDGTAFTRAKWVDD